MRFISRAAWPAAARSVEHISLGPIKQSNAEVPDIKTKHAPVNQFYHAPEFPDATFTDVVRANADTLYSFLWFDVSREPLVLDVPNSGGRLLPPAHAGHVDGHRSRTSPAFNSRRPADVRRLRRSPGRRPPALELWEPQATIARCCIDGEDPFAMAVHGNMLIACAVYEEAL